MALGDVKFLRVGVAVTPHVSNGTTYWQAEVRVWRRKDKDGVGDGAGGEFCAGTYFHPSPGSAEDRAREMCRERFLAVGLLEAVVNPWRTEGQLVKAYGGWSRWLARSG